MGPPSCSFSARCPAIVPSCRVVHQDEKLILNGSVLTNIVEIWKCTDCSSQVNTRVSTVQVDLCHRLDLQFAKREHYHSLVRAGVHDLSLSFSDSPAHRLQSGFAQMKAHHADLQEHTDQFIVRFVGDQLLQELIGACPTATPPPSEVSLSIPLKRCIRSFVLFLGPGLRC